MRKTLFALALFSAVFAMAFAVEDLPVFHQWVPDSLVARPPVYHWTLDNGLEVLFWENHTVPLAACRVMIKTGSAFEGKYLGCGISHYLEHLVSGGTTSKHTEDEYKMMVQQYGLSTNAYTTSDVTVYHDSGPAKYFPQMLGMLADWVQDCAFDPKEVEREKGVITNEIKMGQEEPGRILWKLYNRTFYLVSPYRHPTIGYLPNFLSITRDDVIDYYNRRYAPNNAILAIAGDLDTATVHRVVDSLFGNWERKRVEDIALPMEPLPTAARVAEQEAEVEVATFRMGFPCTYFGDDDEPALRVLGMILSGVRTSRLDLRLVENDNPLCHNISAYYSPKFRERGQFIISGSFDYEKRDRVIAAIWDEIEKVKRHGVSAEEVEWAKNYVIKSLKRGAETVDDQASTLLYSFLTTGKPFYLDFYLQRISRVTPGDVRRVAEKYLVPEHMILAIVKPYGATCPGDSLTAAHAGGGAPKFEVFTLDNGVRLVLAENDAVQTEDLAVYTLGGQIFEPAEKAGLAKFTANYLREGTKKYPDFMALQGILDKLNVRLDVDGGTHTIYMTANFVPSDLDATAEILEQLFMYPTFPRRAEQKLRERQIAQIRQAHSSWASDAFMFFNEKFYGDHPYARPVAGYEETVAKLTAKDAREYWDSVLNPQNIVVAASGPVPVDVMKERLSKIFGKIKGGGQLPEIPEPAPHQKDEYYEKEVNREQVTLIVGYDACGTRNEQDRWALVAAARLLSGTGGLSGWLPVELRGKRDLVYIAWAGYAGKLYGGHFYLAAQCQPENADTVKAIMLRLVEKLKSGDFTDEELKRITDATAEQMMFSKQRQSDIVSEKGLDVLYGFGVDYSDGIPDKIRAVKKDDVVRVANKYFVHPVIVMMKPAKTDANE